MVSQSLVFPKKYLQDGLGQALDAVRGQIFDHASAVPAQFYLDQEVRYNTQAAFLGRPSNGFVQKLARAIMVSADPTAPVKYSDQGSQKVVNNRQVQKLSD